MVDDSQCDSLDADDVEYYSCEFDRLLEEEKNGGFDVLFRMSNLRFSRTLYEYFRGRYPGMIRYELPGEQIFSFGPCGIRRVANILRNCITSLLDRVDDYRCLLKKVSGSTSIEIKEFIYG